MDSNEKAIIRTLLYSDIFDYPLHKDQIWKYLISEKKVAKDRFDQKIKEINTIVYREREMFFIKGKNSEILERIRKTWESDKKIRKAYNIIKKLFTIPTVRFIGISGNLSMMNAEKKDDIDLFVITSKNSAWITRILLITMLKLMGKHRKRGDVNVSDKYCLNMIVDEEALALPNNLRNLYTAHEIAQLMPVVERENTYRRFVNANSWVIKYLPNSISEMKKQKIEKIRKSNWNNLVVKLLGMRIIEKTAMLFQKFLIKRNLSREIIKDNFIALHPIDYSGKILSSYSSKLSQYGL